MDEVQFPIYHLTKGVKLPEKGIYLVVARNGVYLHKDNFMCKAFVKVEDISFLEPMETEITLKTPKLPGRIIGQALTFFRQAFFKHRSESGLILFYSPVKQEYKLWCPNQTVSYGSCKYDRNDYGEKEPDLAGYNVIGTIHSHADFGAFHSGTDTSDEADFHGIHITLGNVDRNNFSMVMSVAISNNRVQLEPEYNCTGLVRADDDSWKSNKWMSMNRKDCFVLDLTEEEQKALEEDAKYIEKLWLPKVNKEVWGGGAFGFASKKKADCSASSDETGSSAPEATSETSTETAAPTEAEQPRQMGFQMPDKPEPSKE
jgi:hypothetical protein